MKYLLCILVRSRYMPVGEEIEVTEVYSRNGRNN